MARLLVVYGTTEGHTRGVAERIAAAAREHGHGADVVDAAALPPDMDPARHDGVVVAASIHRSRHQAPVERFAREHVDALRRLPTALFSVSLVAGLADAGHRQDAWTYVETFVERTGWKPGQTFLVGGALPYSRYGFFKRLLMRMIARARGGGTDPSRDYDYTDWDQLRRDAESFLARLSEPETAAV